MRNAAEQHARKGSEGCVACSLLYMGLCASMSSAVGLGCGGVMKISDSHGTKLAERTLEWAFGMFFVCVFLWAGGPEKCQDLGMGFFAPQVAGPARSGAPT